MKITGLITTILVLLTSFGMWQEYSLAQNAANPIAIVVESNGFVPNNYPAAAPISFGSVVSVVAVGGDGLSSYTWSINNRNVPEYSGIGQSRININVTDQPIRIGVVVNRGQSLVGSASTKITPKPVELVMYQNHPTRGPLYSNALSGLVRTTSAVLDVIAVPFGANAEELGVRWSFNSNSLGIQEDVSISQSNSGGIESLMAIYPKTLFSRLITKSIEVQFPNSN